MDLLGRMYLESLGTYMRWLTCNFQPRASTYAHTAMIHNAHVRIVSTILERDQDEYPIPCPCLLCEHPTHTLSRFLPLVIIAKHALAISQTINSHAFRPLSISLTPPLATTPLNTRISTNRAVVLYSEEAAERATEEYEHDE